MTKKNKSDRRILSIDLLRVLAIILIIGFHVAYEITTLEWLRGIGFIGVSLFFIISGFVLAKNHPSLEKFSVKWFLKRFVKVASVYYLAIISILLIFPKLYSDILDVILHFLFINPVFPKYAFTIISPAWFLTPLIAMYLFYPYLNRLIKKDNTFLILAFFIMVVARILLGGLVSYNPLFFLGEFCFGIAFAHSKGKPAVLISLVTIFVNPIMIIPFILFYILYFMKIEYLPTNILHFIGINTFLLFLYHEAFMKVILGKWSVYSLNIVLAVIVLILAVLITSYMAKKLQDYLLTHKFFLGKLYEENF